MKEEEIFSKIPMRTWRWLGVNEIPYPEGTSAQGEIKKQQILVEDGGEDAVTLAFREGGSHEVLVHVGKGAKLSLVLAALAPEDAGYTCRVRATVEAGGRLSYTGVETGAHALASEVAVSLVGDGSTADVWSLYFGSGDRRLDLNYSIRQIGRHTEADMQVRGALLGRAEKNFRGTLDFHEGCSGSVGRENEEVMLLSPDVRNRSVPLMLSHEDDVDGHHAVAIGRMDEAKLFYLMSRGLDEAEARRLIVEAGFRPVLDRIADEALREEIAADLERRLTNG